MFYVSLLLGVLLIYAAARKLSHKPAVVESYRKVGVPENRLNLLAAILLAAAAGLLVGHYVPYVGIATALGLVVYFGLAVGAHIRFKDTAHILMPVIMLALSLAALALRLVPV